MRVLVPVLVLPESCTLEVLWIRHNSYLRNIIMEEGTSLTLIVIFFSLLDQRNKFFLNFIFRAVYCNCGQKRGEGGALRLVLQEQATSSEENNRALKVGGINGMDVSERGRRNELREVIMKLGAYKENVLDG